MDFTFSAESVRISIKFSEGKRNIKLRLTEFLKVLCKR